MIEIKPSQGRLLIAEPFLGDPNFERSVILLCVHNEQGTLGFVLNQPVEANLADIWKEAYVDFPVFLGGPVEKNTLHFIHRLGDKIEGAEDIGNGLFWGGDYEQVRTLLNLGKVSENDIRFFAGYSGWASGQLANEIKHNSWILSETDASFIFDTPSKEFWRSVLKRMGGENKAKANYPIDPRMN